jgi:hypothetical protein
MFYIITLIAILSIGFFLYKRDPNEKIKREIQKKLAQATMFQRIGKLKEYAELIAEVEQLEKKQNGQ